MRGLNLSALSARGRAAEGMHTARVQASQAAALRKRLSERELAALRSSSDKAAPTVDVLGSISAQSALARLAVEHARTPSVPVLKAGQIPETLRTSASMGTVTLRPDPPVMRALGANKLALFQEMSRHAPPSRPLPGSEKYADGAAIGMMSFSLATAVVGGVGVAAIGAMYFNPSIVERMKLSTIRFRESIDRGLGKRMRSFANRMRQDEALVSHETIERARTLARRAAHIQIADEVQTSTRRSDDSAEA